MGRDESDKLSALPAFELMNVFERLLPADVTFDDPPDSVACAAALLDRCFAASYFRFQKLA